MRRFMAMSGDEEAVHPAKNDWTKALKVASLVLVVLALLALTTSQHLLVLHFLTRQDLPLAGLMVLMFLWWERGGTASQPASMIDVPGLRTRAVLLLALLLVALCWSGRILLMSDFALSRDEQLALFSAEAIGHGRLYGLIEEPWRSVRSALNLTFMVDGGPAAVWMPVYLAGNAFLHALVGLLAPMGLTNPLLNAVGLLSVWGVAKIIWPGRHDVHCVAVLLFALSGQMLALGMTSYAMTGHLALNMLWLWLFLKDRWWSHGGAVGVGLIATGLHQLPFHPLFAAPILSLLIVHRRWRLAAYYIVAYALIGLFWISYLKFPLFALPAGTDAGQGAERVADLATGAFGLSLLDIGTQAANMMRFFAWQHLLLLPLMIVGANAAVRRRDPLQIALLGAFLLMVVTKLLMRPYQGHGWGFRYMHGLIGVACITAAFGWVELRERGLIGWRQLRLASLLTIGVAMPWLASETHRMVRATAVLAERIQRQPVDAVIIADASAPFATDLVYNRPDLNNRPITLRGSLLSEDDIARLCDRYKLAELTAVELDGLARYFGTARPHSPARSLADGAPSGCFQPLRP